MPTIDHLTPEQLEDMVCYVHDNWPVHVFSQGYTTQGKVWGAYSTLTESLKDFWRSGVPRGIEKEQEPAFGLYKKWAEAHL